MEAPEPPRRRRGRPARMPMPDHAREAKADTQVILDAIPAAIRLAIAQAFILDAEVPHAGCAAIASKAGLDATTLHRLVRRLQSVTTANRRRAIVAIARAFASGASFDEAARAGGITRSALVHLLISMRRAAGVDLRDFYHHTPVFYETSLLGTKTAPLRRKRRFRPAELMASDPDGSIVTEE